MKTIASIVAALVLSACGQGAGNGGGYDSGPDPIDMMIIGGMMNRPTYQMPPIQPTRPVNCQWVGNVWSCY